MIQKRKRAAVKRSPGRASTVVRDGGADDSDHSRSPIEDIRLQGLLPNTLLAPHFRFYELTRSEVAERQGIDNALASEQELHAAVYLARPVLEPIREAFGGLSPNSVYHSQILERALKRKPSGWIWTPMASLIGSGATGW